MLILSIIQVESGVISGSNSSSVEVKFGQKVESGVNLGVKLEANMGQNKGKIRGRLGKLNWKFMILPLVSFKNRGKPQKYR